MRENITFSINIEPLDTINPLISRYSCNIMAVDVEAKSFVFHKEILEKLVPTLKGAPILTYYSAYDNSFAGHEGDYFPSKIGKLKRTPPLSPVGFVDYVSEPEFKIIDNIEWLTCSCYLWDGRFDYLQNLSEKEVWQSVEVAVDYDQMPDGTKVITDAILLGLALIGISPAFEGATFYTDNFSNQDVLSEVELLKQEYKEFINNKDLMVASSSVIEEISVNEDIATLNINASNEIEGFSNNNINNQEKEEGEKVIIKAVEKFSLTARQIDEILSNALSAYKYQCGENEYRRYWVRTYDDELVYVCDYEDDKTYSFRYFIVDNVATIDMESRNQVIDGGFISVKPETAQLSEEGGNTEELSAEQLSSNEFVDNAAMQELNENSAEDNKELAEENLENPTEVNTSEEVSMSETEEEIEEPEDKDTVIMSLRQEISDLQEKFSKMESDVNIYIEENTQLKEFKTNIEKQNKEFSIEATLKEVLNILPVEEIDNCRLSAEDFSLDNIDIWKNEVKAKAFNFSKGISEKKPFIQVAFPNTDTPKSGTGLWD